LKEFNLNTIVKAEISFELFLYEYRKVILFMGYSEDSVSIALKKTSDDICSISSIHFRWYFEETIEILNFLSRRIKIFIICARISKCYHQILLCILHLNHISFVLST